MSANFTVVNAAGKLVRTDCENINVSNSNACAILSCLGFDREFWETPPIEIDEMIGACERFLNSEISDLVDGGIDATETKGKGGMTLIDCGMREGYLEEKVNLILTEARIAKDRGAVECYFS